MRKNYSEMGPAKSPTDVVVCLEAWWPRDGKGQTKKTDEAHRIQAVLNRMKPVSISEIASETGCNLSRVLGHVNFEINDRKRVQLCSEPNRNPKAANRSSDILPMKTRIYGEETVTTAISIPQRIKKKMIEFKKRHEVNWSQIAVTAFIQHMEEND